MTAELLDLARKVAGWARDGEQVEAYVAHVRDTEVEVYQGELESLSSAETDGIGIRVISGHRQGFAYSGALDPKSVEHAFAEARDNATFGTEDEALGLAEPDGVSPAALDLWREDLVSFPTERKVTMAIELDRATRAADPRIRNLRSAGYGDGLVEVAIATSTGIATAYRRTGCSLTASAIAGDVDDTQTGYGWSVGRGPADLDVAVAASMAADRATRLLGAKQPPSARVTVVLDKQVTATLIGILAGTLNAEAVLKGRSLFADRMDDDVAAAAVTLTDDPTEAAALAAAPFDAEGIATRRVPLLEGGVLRGFAHNTYTARRSGVRSTGSAVRAGFKSAPGVGCRALALVPGEGSQEDVLRRVGDCLLVQSVTGVHSGVNTVSGDFSVGAEGLLYKGGEVAGPVREITIASTLQRMLKDVVAIGDDLEWLPGGAAGVTIAIRDVTMSGA